VVNNLRCQAVFAAFAVDKAIADESSARTSSPSMPPSWSYSVQVNTSPASRQQMVT
jgi:hypothetical protein